MIGKGKKEKDNILEKARRYCAFQEHCISDVEKKLFEWKVKKAHIPKIIESLIKDDYIDEQRYAAMFVSGKVRIKNWGRLKIKAGLRAKKIPDHFIQKAISAIDEEDYLSNLKALIEKKRTSLKEPDSSISKTKVLNFALSKGYERGLVFKLADDRRQ